LSAWRNYCGAYFEGLSLCQCVPSFSPWLFLNGSCAALSLVAHHPAVHPEMGVQNHRQAAQAMRALAVRAMVVHPRRAAAAPRRVATRGQPQARRVVPRVPASFPQMPIPVVKRLIRHRRELALNAALGRSSTTSVVANTATPTTRPKIVPSAPEPPSASLSIAKVVCRVSGPRCVV